MLSTSPEPEVQCTAGISVSNGVLFSECNGPIDTLIAISGEGALGELSPDLFRWIRKRAARVRRIASVCTGTLMLAPTGVLDGKRITTHWHHVDKLTKLYPHLRVEKDTIYIKDGNVYTTAGVAAGIDLALGFVEEDLVHEVATSIARELVLYRRCPGSEAQYSTILSQQADVSGTPMQDLPAWAMARLNQRLDVHSLAKVVAMTTRTFAGQFEVHFRTTPARWLQSLRVEAACGRLEAQALPVKAIARLTGFRDEQSLRCAFVQQLSMTPVNTENSLVPSWRAILDPILRENRRRRDGSVCNIGGSGLSQPFSTENSLSDTLIRQVASSATPNATTTKTAPRYPR
ncbi:GlxA family transcriptional regulator [Acidisarcina polymorpha]|uniref:GlxA family transcriptional regulator n=1 Tax=Acidisarcina polymorpha TaxID=2211140 RepID=UPI0039C8A6EB